jgi:hypothetical protein
MADEPIQSAFFPKKNLDRTTPDEMTVLLKNISF